METQGPHGLYFIGEAVDVPVASGLINFQWACVLGDGVAAHIATRK